LFESVVTLFATLTEHAPVLLLVDDAHWADGGTLFLLRHLARRGRAARLRLLIVLTYREVEIDEACCLPEVLHDLNRERLATRLKLGRLSREQTGALLEVMFEEEITSDFLESLYRETEGNPFFLEEVCKALIEEGKLYYADGHWRRPNMNEIEIPQSVRVAIQARLSKLPASSQDVLRLAAILGREFDFETLRQAGDPSSGSGQALDEESLIEALENATRAQLISENRQGRRLTFAFAHALIPSTLRESLSGLRRQRLHRRAADAIAELRPDDFETLAYHFEHAGDLGQARVYYAQAGDRALTVYANPEAERHYRAALELSDSDADRARLLAGLGESLFRQSHYAEAAQTWLEAIALYRSLMDYDQVARWYARAARAAWYTDDWPRGLALCREGLQVMAGQPETPGLAALLHETGRACLFNKLPDEALLLCQQALPLAERLGLAEVQAETLATMGILSNLPIEAKKQALERAIELAESAKLLATAARGHLNLGGLLSDQGQPRVALAHYQRARELAHQMGIATWEFDYLGVFANVSLNLGDYATVETELITLRKLRETLPATSRLAFFPEMLEAMLQGFRGQLAEGAARIRALYIEVSQHPDSKFLHELDGILAQFYIFQGEFVQAEQCAHGGLERALHLGLEGNEAYFYAMLCLALSGQGRCVEAHQALEAVRQKQKSPSGLFDQAALHWAESALAVAEKRWDEALAAFEAGTQVISALGLRWHQARAFREWAEAYLGRDRPGDRERAIDLLRQSQALFEELKVPHFARLVGERLESLVVLSPA
jgi:tetratricopeptide (TPR) repeat protein